MSMQQLQGNQLLSGYEEEFVNAVDEDLTCPVCRLPLRSAVLTSCGHRFCKGCIDELCRRENANTRNDLRASVQLRQVTCPVDRTKLLRDKDVFHDKFTERKILSLVIKCSKEGCEWTGELNEKEEHYSECKRFPVNCPMKCGQVIPREDLTIGVGIRCATGPCLFNMCHMYKNTCTDTT
ncbi:hypothetical protein ACROYT_G042416 [Oculina patagonica]